MSSKQQVQNKKKKPKRQPQVTARHSSQAELTAALAKDRDMSSGDQQDPRVDIELAHGLGPLVPTRPLALVRGIE